jgi:hypothetical protein
MITGPTDTPLTIPLREPTDAMGPEVGDQRPPDTVSVSRAVDPTHTLDGPVIAVGDKLTVTVFVTTHPLHDVNDIVVVPVLFPWTIPVEALMLATRGLVLVQLVGQDGNESVSVIVAPTHKALGPPIGDGVGLIDIVITPDMVRKQPVNGLVATIV